MKQLEPNNLEIFFDFVEKNICNLTQVQKKQYECFYNLLFYNNLKYNLISRKETDIVDRHFINSVLLAHYIKHSGFKTLLDIGSGGGFPGIILKFLFPDSLFVLNDSVRKKTDFLYRVIRETEIQNIYVENCRAEKLQKNYPLFFDIITARAVTSLSELYKISKPLLKPDGVMYFYKGKNFEKELNELNQQFQLTESTVIFLRSLPFAPDSQNGCIIRIKV